MSASSTPTRRPFARKAKARLEATVDLPTPPLPEATATIASMPGTAPPSVRCCGRACRAAGDCGAFGPRAVDCAVSTADTESTSGSASIAFSAALRKGSSRGPRSGSTSIEKATLPSRMTIPETMPSETMSAPLSGSATAANASRICCCVTAGMSVLLARRTPQFCAKISRAWLTIPVRQDRRRVSRARARVG